MLGDVNTGLLVKKITKGLEWHKNIKTALLTGFCSSNKQASRTSLHHMPSKKDHQGAFPSSSWFPGRESMAPLPHPGVNQFTLCVDSRTEERTYIVYQPTRVGNCPSKVTVGLLEGFIFPALVFLSC